MTFGLDSSNTHTGVIDDLEFYCPTDNASACSLQTVLTPGCSREDEGQLMEVTVELRIMKGPIYTEYMYASDPVGEINFDADSMLFTIPSTY